MQQSDIISAAKQYMESIHQNDFTGHDIAHVYRVTALAKSIAENEGVNDTLVIELACLLHDTVDEKVVDGLFKYPHFLWFDLGRPDIWITIIAGVLYFIQAYVSSKTMPDEQRQMGYMMMVISPIMIIWISLSSASALGLYWSVSAAFLVVQTHFANIYYEKVAKKEVQPFIEAYEREHNGGSNKKGKNTQVVSKKKKK